MSEQQTIAALGARMAELERELATLKQSRPAVGSWLPRRRVAVFGLMLALLALPGVVLASDRFADVADTHPFHADIDWIADYGIANGFDDGTYRPGQPVTRQAMAAFMHRLSNEFEVVRTTLYAPGAGTEFTNSSPCPDDKRPIAGAGATSELGLFITDSQPDGSSWTVRWETDDNAVISPEFLVVHVTCAPRL